jgi:hypothetical protein
LVCRSVAAATTTDPQPFFKEKCISLSSHPTIPNCKNQLSNPYSDTQTKVNTLLTLPIYISMQKQQGVKLTYIHQNPV